MMVFLINPLSVKVDTSKIQSSRLITCNMVQKGKAYQYKDNANQNLWKKVLTNLGQAVINSRLFSLFHFPKGNLLALGSI